MHKSPPSSFYKSKGIGLKAVNSITTNSFITIFITILFFIVLWYAYKNSKKLLFIGIFLLVSIGGTLFIIQQHWDQERLILIYIPLLIIFIGEGISKSVKAKFDYGKYLIYIFLGICTLASIGMTIKRIDLDTTIANLKGDKYYGFAPDWQNYLKMTEWVGATYPREKVAARKPFIASIYSGGNTFHGIYRIPNNDPDQLLELLTSNNVNYVIMANLRANPKQKTERTINTVRRYLAIITSVYPYKFSLVHRIGDDERSYLFKIENDNQPSESRLDAALIINPNDVRLLLTKASNLINQQKYDLAMRFLDQALTVTTQEPNIFFYRGNVYFAKGNFNLAIQEYTNVLNLRQDVAVAYYNRALCYHNLNQPIQAKQDLEQAIALNFSSVDPQIRAIYIE